ncbi:DLP12 prophage; DNA base-flipping protein [Escherichia coli]|nr:DLP12 prophage; DNA base-flipping protein [Escherichia coli]
MHLATWVQRISEYLISRGKTFATPDWVKDALKHTYLGMKPKKLVDVVSGEITTIQSLRHTSDRYRRDVCLLCKVEAWAVNIGCHLTIPQSCEFQLLRDKQEA